VEVDLVIAPGSEQFFASQHRARVVAVEGTILADWEITDAAAPITVPAGTYRLQAFTVFLSDFIQCSADPAGQQHCAQPTLGPSQVCEVPIEVVAGATVEAHFRSLPDGRCDLALGPASAEPSDAARVCGGTGWSPLAADVPGGLTATATDRAHVTIRNPTNRALSYRLSGWVAQTLEDCTGLAEIEIEQGPIAAGAKIRTTFGDFVDQPTVPVTLGWLDGPCGEACNRAAIGGVRVSRSAVEPLSS
jgi:hypothetical protein